jgi:hypothetical protein
MLSETSLTTSALVEPVKACATFRVTGDQLVPEQVTRVLRIVPTLAYAKGDHFTIGPSSSVLIGRTGVWYFCTDGIVAGNRLRDHAMFLVTQVVPGPEAIGPLQQLLRRKSLRAVTTCFRHGPAGT